MSLSTAEGPNGVFHAASHFLRDCLPCLAVLCAARSVVVRVWSMGYTDASSENPDQIFSMDNTPLGQGVCVLERHKRGVLCMRLFVWVRNTEAISLGRGRRRVEKHGHTRVKALHPRSAETVRHPALFPLFLCLCDLLASASAVLLPPRPFAF